MKSFNLFQLLCLSILLICCKASFSQEIKNTTPKTEFTDSVSDDSLSNIRFLIILLSMRDANQNDSSLYYYWKNIEYADLSNSALYKNDYLLYSIDPSLSASGSLMYGYRKIDVSNSRNLDYKTLSGKYPKTFEEKHPWGGLMLYSIISSLYPNHGYAPALNTK